MRRFKTSYGKLFLRRKHFDAAFYLGRYPDVGAARMHPFAHYLVHGAAEGRKPNARFDPDYYLAGSAEARRRGGDPFVDYLVQGFNESPHPLVNGKSSSPPTEGSLFGCAS